MKIVNFELFTLQLQPNCTCNYSKTDSGASELGTDLESNRHFYKGCFSRSEIIGFPTVLIQLKPPGRGQPLQKGHKQLNLYCPMHPEVLLYMHASRHWFGICTSLSTHNAGTSCFMCIAGRTASVWL